MRQQVHGSRQEKREETILQNGLMGRRASSPPAVNRIHGSLSTPRSPLLSSPLLDKDQSLSRTRSPHAVGGDRLVYIERWGVFSGKWGWAGRRWRGYSGAQISIMLDDSDGQLSGWDAHCHGSVTWRMVSWNCGA
jgi:hypothetical protein